MTRDEARGRLVEILLAKIRHDRYPSVTQMRLVEQIIPRRMVPAYLDVLIGKIGDVEFPDIPMLKRIARVADTLPKAGAR